METITFTEILSRLSSNPNVTRIEIHRSKSYCGCANPGDIIAVTAYSAKHQSLRCALQRVFDEQPTINVEKRYVDENGNYLYTLASKDYAFAR